MDGNVLLLGADERLRTALELLVPGTHVKAALGAVDTEGIGIDVVVIAGEHPIAELTEVRVHPRLYATPVVLFAPGHRFNDNDFHAIGVWPVTQHGFLAVEDLTGQIERLLSRAHHPSGSTSNLRAVS